jgi:hypothetical protein
MAISQNFPNTRPSLNLNFARSKKLDPRITFTRSSTATYVDEDGLIKSVATNTPRFDHDPTTGDCLGLLIEESRSNLFNNSNDFTTWTKQTDSTGAVGITTNSITSPDGTVNSTRYFVQTAGGSFYSLYRGISVSASTSYTYSVFIKVGENTSTNLVVYDGVGSASVGFDLNTGASTGTYPTANTSIQSASSVNYGNGWYRYYMTFTSTLSGTFQFKLDLGTTTLNQGFYIWGAQLEAGAFPTSYIPTVASTVTRSADNASITGTNFSSFYNPNEGSVLFSGRVGGGAEPSFLNFSNAAVSPTDFMRYTYLGLSRWIGFFSSGKVYDISSENVFARGSFFKTAGCYKLNDFANVLNGGTVGTDTSGNVPVVNRLQLGDVTSFGSYLNGTISQLTYYPVRLSNSQLQTLTK